MDGIAILILLYLAAVLILVAEIFIPSHGILSVVGIGFLIAAVWKTFEYGEAAGTIAILASLVFIPAFMYVSVKVWHRTPMGRAISPPNPELTAADIGVPLRELEALVGRSGRTVSPLRPVGICEFYGRRLSCVAELGVLEAGVKVKAVGLKGGTLAVVEDQLA
jgi:membrane-bound ClpP family serine protease